MLNESQKKQTLTIVQKMHPDFSESLYYLVKSHNNVEARDLLLTALNLGFRASIISHLQDSSEAVKSTNDWVTASSLLVSSMVENPVHSANLYRFGSHFEHSNIQVLLTELLTKHAKYSYLLVDKLVRSTKIPSSTTLSISVPLVFAIIMNNSSDMLASMDESDKKKLLDGK